MNNKKYKKVAFIATVYRHLEAFHIPFIKLLQDKGFEVHAYGALDFGKEGLLRNNVICHDIPFKRNPFHLKNSKALIALVKSFEKEEYEMVHFHTPVASIIGRIAAKIARIPYVIYTAHGFHFFEGASKISWLLYYPLEKVMARLTDALITINNEDFKRAKNFRVRDKVYFVPGVGVETKEFAFENEAKIKQNKRAELGLSDTDFVIVCVAELNDNKNQNQLIEAVQVLTRKYNEVKCLLVGVGESEQALKDKVKSLNLNNTIQLLGFRNDIPELLAAGDVIALLSKREGLPKALMEALAASKPIVSTDIRGSRDTVVDGVNGYLVPVSDVTATVNVFNALLSAPSELEKMGKQSKKMSFKYDLNNILFEMYHIYKKALKIEE